MPIMPKKKQSVTDVTGLPLPRQTTISRVLSGQVVTLVTNPII